MAHLIINITALAFICFYAAVRLRYELQMLQQNSYRLGRYFRWLKGDLANVNRITDLIMAAVVIGFHGTRWDIYARGAVGLLALYKAVRELRIKYKKPLVFTARATRLYIVGLVLLAAAMSPFLLSGPGAFAIFTAMAFAALSPLWISFALILLMPVEALINRWYIDDARRILRSMPNLKVVGITGSYGKTSTKHYLYRILSERFNVVMTPGSFNTTLGVVRTIREHLKPYTEVFIVEMGAKQSGDIAEICDLVHPSIGIITAVGEQHLESFKTIENVQKTKFELVDALPPDGVAILNNDFEYVAERPVTNVARVIRYSSREGQKAKYHITDIRHNRGGTTFAIGGPDDRKSTPYTTKLAGSHNLSNILASCLAGGSLGMTGDEMRYAVGRIEQVEHRLDIKHTPGGITIIDDAFNSNPHGAAMALDVLSDFTEGRRIVVTPGMIELGAKQEHYNREFGHQMAAACDYAIVVGEYNREAILTGLTEGGFDAACVYTARDFADASAKVREIARCGDTILYENDLPDTFK